MQILGIELATNGPRDGVLLGRPAGDRLWVCRRRLAAVDCNVCEPAFTDYTQVPLKLYRTIQPTLVVQVKIQFSHARYLALGPKLIPVYRQSALR